MRDDLPGAFEVVTAAEVVASRNGRWGVKIGDDYNIHVDLPRATVGGLKKGPVEDLLRVIARDYAELEAENNRLWQPVRQLESVPAEADPAAGDAPAAPDKEIDTLSDLVSLEERNGHPDPHLPIDPPLTVEAPRQAPPKPRDDLAVGVLAMAQRSARDLREATRDECELIIRKTRARAQKLERELEQNRAVTNAELEELRALKHEMREHMSSSLRALLRTFLDERPGEMPALDWTETSGFVRYAESEPMRRKKKHKKSTS